MTLQAEQEKRRERITARVAAGVSITRVGAEEGLTRQRVSQIIHERGLRFGLPRQVQAAREQIAEAIALHREGFSTAEIAKRLHRDHLELRWVLRRNDVLALSQEGRLHLERAYQAHVMSDWKHYLDETEAIHRSFVDIRDTARRWADDVRSAPQISPNQLPLQLAA